LTMLRETMISMHSSASELINYGKSWTLLLAKLTLMSRSNLKNLMRKIERRR
jgi:hypothetical protein